MWALHLSYMLSLLQRTIIVTSVHAWGQSYPANDCRNDFVINNNESTNLNHTGIEPGLPDSQTNAYWDRGNQAVFTFIGIGSNNITTKIPELGIFYTEVCRSQTWICMPTKNIISTQKHHIKRRQNLSTRDLNYAPLKIKRHEIFTTFFFNENLHYVKYLSK